MARPPWYNATHIAIHDDGSEHHLCFSGTAAVLRYAGRRTKTVKTVMTLAGTVEYERDRQTTEEGELE